MSLLLKALQRASKNREEQGAIPDGRNGLAIELEPGDIEPPRAPRRDPDAGVRSRGSLGLGNGIATGELDDSRGRGPIEDRFEPMEWIRDHPVHLFAIAALLFLVGYFIYVYIAISNPAFFAGGGASRDTPAPPVRPTTAAQEPRQETARPEPPAAPPMPAVDTRPVQPAEGAGPAALPPAPPAPSLAPALSAPPQGTAASASAGGSLPPPPPSVALTVADAGGGASVRPRRSPRSALREPQGTDLVESAPRQAERPLQEGVRVRPTEAGDATQARLTEAYDALQRRDLERARTLYESVIAADDRNIDGMLGLAATSWQQGQADRASDQYYRVLQLDPQNAAAQAGLIGLSGQVDPVASETRLKQLIARDPSALLYASLGHLHASQSQWSNAQQAYFQAHQLEPTNPDYAYNLAVGLEHVGQRGIAVGYYRKALDLARARGRAGFDADQVTARVAKLSAAVE
jgi:hypothetical protein